MEGAITDPANGLSAGMKESLEKSGQYIVPFITSLNGVTDDTYKSIGGDSTSSMPFITSLNGVSSTEWSTEDTTENGSTTVIPFITSLNNTVGIDEKNTPISDIFDTSSNNQMSLEVGGMNSIMGEREAQIDAGFNLSTTNPPLSINHMPAWVSFDEKENTFIGNPKSIDHGNEANFIEYIGEDEEGVKTVYHFDLNTTDAFGLNETTQGQAEDSTNKILRDHSQDEDVVVIDETTGEKQTELFNRTQQRLVIVSDYMTNTETGRYLSNLPEILNKPDSSLTNSVRSFFGASDSELTTTNTVNENSLMSALLEASGVDLKFTDEHDGKYSQMFKETTRITIDGMKYDEISPEDQYYSGDNLVSTVKHFNEYEMKINYSENGKITSTELYSNKSDITTDLISIVEKTEFMQQSVDTEYLIAQGVSNMIAQGNESELSTLFSKEDLETHEAEEIVARMDKQYYFSDSELVAMRVSQEETRDFFAHFTDTNTITPVEDAYSVVINKEFLGEDKVGFAFEGAGDPMVLGEDLFVGGINYNANHAGIIDSAKLVDADGRYIGEYGLSSVGNGYSLTINGVETPINSEEKYNVALNTVFESNFLSRDNLEEISPNTYLNKDSDEYKKLNSLDRAISMQEEKVGSFKYHSKAEENNGSENAETLKELNAQLKTYQEERKDIIDNALSSKEGFGYASYQEPTEEQLKKIAELEVKLDRVNNDSIPFNNSQVEDELSEAKSVLRSESILAFVAPEEGAINIVENNAVSQTTNEAINVAENTTSAINPTDDKPVDYIKEDEDKSILESVGEFASEAILGKNAYGADDNPVDLVGEGGWDKFNPTEDATTNENNIQESSSETVINEVQSSEAPVVESSTTDDDDTDPDDTPPTPPTPPTGGGSKPETSNEESIDTPPVEYIKEDEDKSILESVGEFASEAIFGKNAYGADDNPVDLVSEDGWDKFNPTEDATTNENNIQEVQELLAKQEELQAKLDNGSFFGRTAAVARGVIEKDLEEVKGQIADLTQASSEISTPVEPIVETVVEEVIDITPEVSTPVEPIVETVVEETISYTDTDDFGNPVDTDFEGNINHFDKIDERAEELNNLSGINKEEVEPIIDTDPNSTTDDFGNPLDQDFDGNPVPYMENATEVADNMNVEEGFESDITPTPALDIDDLTSEERATWAKMTSMEGHDSQAVLEVLYNDRLNSIEQSTPTEVVEEVVAIAPEVSTPVEPIVETVAEETKEEDDDDTDPDDTPPTPPTGGGSKPEATVNNESTAQSTPVETVSEVASSEQKQNNEVQPTSISPEVQALRGRQEEIQERLNNDSFFGKSGSSQRDALERELVGNINSQQAGQDDIVELSQLGLSPLEKSDEWNEWPRGNFDDKETKIYTGNLEDVLEDKNLASKSFVLYTDNPFNPEEKTAILFNSNILPEVASSLETNAANDAINPGSYRNMPGFHTTGSAIMDGEDRNIIAINTTPEEIKETYINYTNDLLENDFPQRIPSSIASTEQEVVDAMNVIADNYLPYVINHEFVHGSNFQKEEAHELSVEAHDDHKLLETQMGEAQSDVGAAIKVMQTMGEDDKENLIKGIMLSRMGGLEGNLFNMTTSGDKSHETSPAMMALLKVQQDNPEFLQNLNNQEIENISENIVRQTADLFVSSQELRDGYSRSGMFFETLDKSDEHRDEMLMTHYEDALTAATEVAKDLDSLKGDYKTEAEQLREEQANLRQQGEDLLETVNNPTGEYVEFGSEELLEAEQRNPWDEIKEGDIIFNENNEPYHATEDMKLDPSPEKMISRGEVATETKEEAEQKVELEPKASPIETPEQVAPEVIDDANTDDFGNPLSTNDFGDNVPYFENAEVRSEQMNRNNDIDMNEAEEVIDADPTKTTDFDGNSLDTDFNGETNFFDKADETADAMNVEEGFESDITPAPALGIDDLTSEERATWAKMTSMEGHDSQAVLEVLYNERHANDGDQPSQQSEQRVESRGKKNAQSNLEESSESFTQSESNVQSDSYIENYMSKSLTENLEKNNFKSDLILSTEQLEQAIANREEALNDTRSIDDIIESLEEKGVLTSPSFFSSGNFDMTSIESLSMREVHAIAHSEKYEEATHMEADWKLDQKLRDFEKSIGAIDNNKFVSSPVLVEEELRNGINKVELLNPELLTQEVAETLFKIDHEAFAYTNLNNEEYSHIDQDKFLELEWKGWSGGEHPDIETQMHKETFNEFYENNANNLEDQSFVLQTKNPFSVYDENVVVLFNSNVVTSEILDDKNADRDTSGQMTRELSTVEGERAHVISINTSEERIAKETAETKKDLLDNHFPDRIPSSLISSKEELMNAVDTYHQHDAQYTLIHELMHGSNYDNHETDISIHQESQADVGAALYLINNTLESDEVEDYIKGNIMSRLAGMSWGVGDKEHAGDIDHQSNPAMLKLLAMYQNDPESLQGLNNSEIANIAENIVRDTEKEFISGAELDKSFDSGLDDQFINDRLNNAIEKAGEYVIALDIDDLKTDYKHELASNQVNEAMGKSFKSGVEQSGPINKLLDSHLDRLKIEDQDSAKDNLARFADFVGQVENSGKTYGGNKDSSAEGLYQFLTANHGEDGDANSSLEAAINRTAKYIGSQDWMKDADKTDSIDNLTREQQTLLFYGDMLEKSGGDAMMRGVIEGGDREFLKAYYELHHTKPDAATIQRAERLIKDY